MTVKAVPDTISGEGNRETVKLKPVVEFLQDV